MYLNTDFETYWSLFRPDERFLNRKDASESEWAKCPPEKKQAIIRWLQQRNGYQGRNPFFFIQDFRLIPKKKPLTLSYREYYARYGTTLEQDGWRSINPTGQQVIYVKEAPDVA